MINIAELLKDAPKGMKLYSPLFGEVKFKYINGSKFGIVVEDSEECYRSFDKYGRYFTIYDNAECLLFPSKGQTWECWKVPVKPKFKLHDWVVFNNSHNSIYQISEIKSSRYTLTHTHGGSMPLLFSQGELLRPWTIQDAKDGDVIAFNDSPDVNLPLRWVGIYKQPRVVNNKSYWFHCIITPDCTFRGYDSWWMTNAHPATKEQRDLLFKKMKEAGYQWDADKKELRKIQPHYDIANFKPFDKVLVRDNDRGKWRPSIFSYHIKGRQTCYPFCCIGNSFSQCIPFEGNEHLLGTTDPCDEQYINW